MRKFLSMVLLLVLVLSVINLSVVQAETVLRYAHTNSPQGAAGMVAQKFAELVAEKTNGEVKIEVYPSAQLGILDEMIQGVSMGSIDMGHNDFAALALLMKELAVFNLPYLYDSPRSALQATGPDSPIIKKMNEKLIKKANVRILFSFYYGTRHLTCNAPIYEPDDLKGKKIRAIPLKVWLETIRGMGAIPTAVDFSELSTALATNIVDGQENPLDTIWSNKFYEFQDYVMLTGHMIATLPVYINENSWHRLNKEQQAAIIEAGREITQWSLDYVTGIETEIIGKLQNKGVTIIGPDNGLQIEKFKDRVTKHINKVFADWEQYIKEIRAAQ